MSKKDDLQQELEKLGGKASSNDTIKTLEEKIKKIKPIEKKELTMEEVEVSIEEHKEVARSRGVRNENLHIEIENLQKSNESLKSAIGNENDYELAERNEKIIGENFRQIENNSKLITESNIKISELNSRKRLLEDEDVRMKAIEYVSKIVDKNDYMRDTADKIINILANINGKDEDCRNAYVELEKSLRIAKKDGYNEIIDVAYKAIGREKDNIPRGREFEFQKHIRNASKIIQG